MRPHYEREDMDNVVSITSARRRPRTIRFVKRHQVMITAIVSTTVTATVLTKMRFNAQDQLLEFIKDRGLLEEYIETYPVITKY